MARRDPGEARVVPTAPGGPSDLRAPGGPASEAAAVCFGGVLWEPPTPSLPFPATLELNESPHAGPRGSIWVTPGAPVLGEVQARRGSPRRDAEVAGVRRDQERRRGAEAEGRLRERKDRGLLRQCDEQLQGARNPREPEFLERRVAGEVHCEVRVQVQLFRVEQDSHHLLDLPGRDIALREAELPEVLHAAEVAQPVPEHARILRQVQLLQRRGLPVVQKLRQLVRCDTTPSEAQLLEALQVRPLARPVSKHARVLGEVEPLQRERAAVLQKLPQLLRRPVAPPQPQLPELRQAPEVQFAQEPGFGIERDPESRFRFPNPHVGAPAPYPSGIPGIGHKPD
mmetsp:Transcript_19433/g.58305  ORF Transcript_19433/g.58305 Transcript_19433/m.58305 type:complete len:341 (+) Transcript_19433:1096-2118(+)